MGAGKRRPRTRQHRRKFGYHSRQWRHLRRGGSPAKGPIDHRYSTKPDAAPTLLDIILELNEVAPGVEWSDIEVSGTFKWSQKATPADHAEQARIKRDAEARALAYRKREYERLRKEFGDG